MENLGFAIQVSVIGIIALLVVLVILAGLISLMTKYLVDKPTKEEQEEQEETIVTEAVVQKDDEPESKQDLKLAAAVALAIYRAQMEMATVAPAETGTEINSWRQMKLINRLNQSSNIRRAK